MVRKLIHKKSVQCCFYNNLPVSWAVVVLLPTVVMLAVGCVIEVSVSSLVKVVCDVAVGTVCR